jgi:hypothetical protein
MLQVSERNLKTLGQIAQTWALRALEMSDEELRLNYMPFEIAIIKRYRMARAA